MERAVKGSWLVKFGPMSAEATLALAGAFDRREHDVVGHSERVADLTVRVAQAMGLPEPEIASAYLGALLHDIGMVCVPDGVLRKPGPLTDGDWELIRRHPLEAVGLLEGFGLLQQVLVIPRYHHERFDGSGYPDGLAQRAIPLAARIFGVVDTWEALTCGRPHRAPWSPERARAYLQLRADQHFDPLVVQTFLALRIDA